MDDGRKTVSYSHMHGYLKALFAIHTQDVPMKKERKEKEKRKIKNQKEHNG